MRWNRVVGGLFDLEWYAGEVGSQFAAEKEALDHYLNKGELAGYFPNPLFDPAYYRTQYGLPDSVNAFMDFCEVGIKENRNPNGYFESDWYRWQNSDSWGYLHPLLHYLNVGGKEFRDPSPYVDMVLVRRNAGNSDTGVTLLNKIVRGQYSSDKGVCLSQRQLAARQRELFGNIKMQTLKKVPQSLKRKYLLWVQCGANSEFFKWYRNDIREWDLLINYYDGSSGQGSEGDFIIEQNGTKFTAIFNVWRYTDIFDGYEYVFFIDDDLSFEYSSIDKYFEYISTHGIDLSQPSLTAGSHCVWPVLFNKRAEGHRYTNGVEIMMPAFSAKCIVELIPFFGCSVSGFGLDFLFAKLARENGLKVAVIDAIRATHNSAIDQESGAYYEMLRNFGINSKYELWSLMQRFDLEPGFYEIHRSIVEKIRDCFWQ